MNTAENPLHPLTRVIWTHKGELHSTTSRVLMLEAEALWKSGRGNVPEKSWEPDASLPYGKFVLLYGEDQLILDVVVHQFNKPKEVEYIAVMYPYLETRHYYHRDEDAYKPVMIQSPRIVELEHVREVHSLFHNNMINH